MKQDRSIHPQKMSPLQPEQRSLSERHSLSKQGDDLGSSLGHIDSLSFAALIQELQSSVLSDISKAVGKANPLHTFQEEEPRYLNPPKVNSPLSGLAGLEALLSMNGNDRPNIGLEALFSENGIDRPNIGLEALFSGNGIERPNIGLEALLSANGNDKGRRLDISSQPPLALPKFCGYCGASRGTDHLFCGDCGQRL
jgi:hypothetical protein